MALVYRQDRLDGPLGEAFTTAAQWSQNGESWEALFPASPIFEIAWREENGRVATMPTLSTPHLEPAFSRAEPGFLNVRIYRIKVESVRALFGIDADEMASAGRIPLDGLGHEWREAARRQSSRELAGNLAKISANAPPPSDLARESVRALRQNIDCREIAERQSYSYEQWLRRMKRECGVCPRFLSAYRRLQSATLLARSHPRMSMDEIAWQTGYAEASNLARAARRLSGQTFRGLVDRVIMPD